MSGPKICSITLQANNTGESQGVSFQFNDTVIKIGRELNARRNQRFLEEYCEAEQYRAVRLFVTPTIVEFQGLALNAIILHQICTSYIFH